MLLSTKYKNRGIGLLELMLSLLIIAVIIFTATRYFEVTNENLRVAQAENMINNIVDASYKWVQGQPNFSGISMDVLIKQTQLLPSNYYFTPWKNGIFSVVVSSQDPQKILIQAWNIPVRSCNNLAEKMKQYAADANCGAIDLNTGTTSFQGTF